MAKKQQNSPSETPSVTPERGLELIRRQQQKGQELLAKRPMDPDDFEAWKLTLRAYLVESFGSDSPNIARVMNAGKPSVLRVGATEEWYEEAYAACLDTQLKLLDSCAEQLEAKIDTTSTMVAASGPTLELDSLHPMVVRRCREPFEAGRYDDAIRNAFIAVEEEIRARTTGDPTDLGVDLVAKAMKPESPQLVFSEIKAEQEAAHLLYRGAIGYIKNPLSHRFLDTSDPVRTFEVLAFASLLLRMLDEATNPAAT